MIRTATFFLLLNFLLLDSLKSTAQWTPVNSGTTQILNDVFFINGSTGLVAGEPATPGGPGLLMKTTNGGQTWSTISTGLCCGFTGVWFVNDKTAFAVNVFGKILKTTDQGATWTTVFDNPAHNLAKIFFADEMTGYVTPACNSSYDGLLKTTDGGVTWVLVGAGQFETIYDAYFISPDTGFVAALEYPSGRIAATYDGGLTWQELLYEGGYDVAKCIGAANKDSIVAGGNGIQLWASSNGGVTWHEITMSAWDLTDMALLSASNIWTSGPGIGHTMDAGHTWTAELQNVAFNAIHFPTHDTGYAVGYSGAIYKYVEGAADCFNSYEPNNMSNQAYPIEVNKKIQTLIAEPGDKDWFQFTSPPGKTNIRILLKSLPKNYNIELFDQNLYSLGSSKHHGKTNDTIIFNNLPAPQTYYIQVKGGNANVFDANDCYSLKVETSSNPFKSTEFYSSEENPEIILFPNPASGKIYLDVPGEDVDGNEVIIYDLAGRKLFSEKIAAGDNAVDISALTQGMYFLEIKNDKGIMVKKFEVNR